MERIVIISKSKIVEVRKDSKKESVLYNEMEKLKPKMHWIYLLSGGFIIGTLCTVSLGALWLLSFRLRQNIIVNLSPVNFIKKCWGYW